MTSQRHLKNSFYITKVQSKKATAANRHTNAFEKHYCYKTGHFKLQHSSFHLYKTDPFDNCPTCKTMFVSTIVDPKYDHMAY